MERYVKTDDNGKIIEVVFTSEESEYVKQPNVYKCDYADIGWIRNTEGIFIAPSQPIIPPQPTLEEQMAQIQSDNIALINALATIYEKLATSPSV